LTDNVLADPNGLMLGQDDLGHTIGRSIKPVHGGGGFGNP